MNFTRNRLWQAVGPKRNLAHQWSVLPKKHGEYWPLFPNKSISETSSFRGFVLRSLKPHQGIIWLCSHWQDEKWFLEQINKRLHHTSCSQHIYNIWTCIKTERYKLHLNSYMCQYIVLLLKNVIIYKFRHLWFMCSANPQGYMCWGFLFPLRWAIITVCVSRICTKSLHENIFPIHL